VRVLDRKFGYARVSTTGRAHGRRLDYDRVFTGMLSGSSRPDRPGLEAMLEYARAETVVVGAIDRLGRLVASQQRCQCGLKWVPLACFGVLCDGCERRPRTRTCDAKLKMCKGFRPLRQLHRRSLPAGIFQMRQRIAPRGHSG